MLNNAWLGIGVPKVGSDSLIDFAVTIVQLTATIVDAIRTLHALTIRNETGISRLLLAVPLTVKAKDVAEDIDALSSLVLFSFPREW